MNRLLFQLLYSGTLYIKVYENQFRIRHIKDRKELTILSPEPYSTERLLIGTFSRAEETLKKGVKKIHKGKWFATSPVALIQPMEKIENGLSEIEERILKEVATAAGIRETVIWVGGELSDQEVLDKVMSL